MEKKIIIARLQVIEGKESELLSLTLPLIEGTRAEEGNLTYTMYQNPHNASEFIFYEEYKDDNAINVHGNSAYFQAFAQGVKPLLVKDMDIQVFQS